MLPGEVPFEYIRHMKLNYNLLFLPKLDQPAFRIFNPNKFTEFAALLFLGKRYTHLFQVLKSLIQIMYLEI